MARLGQESLPLLGLPHPQPRPWTILWDEDLHACGLFKGTPGNSIESGQVRQGRLGNQQSLVSGKLLLWLNGPLFPLRNYRVACWRCTSGYSIWGARKLRCTIHQSLFQRWLMATSEISNWYFLLAWSGPSFSYDQKVTGVFSDQLWVCRSEC